MKTSQTDTLKNFQDSDAPQCLYDGQNNIYKLNEAAYRQIAHIADMLAAISCWRQAGRTVIQHAAFCRRNAGTKPVLELRIIRIV